MSNIRDYQPPELGPPHFSPNIEKPFSHVQHLEVIRIAHGVVSDRRAEWREGYLALRESLDNALQEIGSLKARVTALEGRAICSPIEEMNG